MSVSITSTLRSMGENGTAKTKPPRCVNTVVRAASDPLVERGLMVMIPPRLTDSATEARGWRANDLTPATVEHWRARFLARLGQTPGSDTCWDWPGYVRPDGYGVFKADRWPYLAHRVAWVLLTGGELTAQLTIDHLCRNRSCVNPAHLEPVSLAGNIARVTGSDLTDHLHVPHCGVCLTRRQERRKIPTECARCGRTVSRKSLRRHMVDVHDIYPEPR